MTSVVETGGRRVLIVAGVMMAALLQTLDATIVNVALPTIEGNIGASINDGTWIITGYIISNVVSIPLAPFSSSASGDGPITGRASSASRVHPCYAAPRRRSRRSSSFESCRDSSAAA